MTIHPKSPSWKTAASEGALPLELFQMAFQTAKAAYVAAAKGNERLACLQGLGTIQNMTSALAGIAPEHGDNLQAIGTKAMRLLPVIKAEAVKEDVLHKSAGSRDQLIKEIDHMWQQYKRLPGAFTYDHEDTSREIGKLQQKLRELEKAEEIQKMASDPRKV